MSFDDRFQPESKYNLERINCLRIKHPKGVSAREKKTVVTRKLNMLEG